MWRGFFSGAISLLLFFPLGFYWKSRVDAQRLALGFATSGTARAQPVHTDAPVSTVVAVQTQPSPLESKNGLRSLAWPAPRHQVVSGAYVVTAEATVAPAGGNWQAHQSAAVAKAQTAQTAAYHNV